jgi:hypothetical protein
MTSVYILVLHSRNEMQAYLRTILPEITPKIKDTAVHYSPLRFEDRRKLIQYHASFMKNYE